MKHRTTLPLPSPPMTPTEPLPPAAFIPVPHPQTVCPLPNPKDTLPPKPLPFSLIGLSQFCRLYYKRDVLLGDAKISVVIHLTLMSTAVEHGRAELGPSHHPIGSDFTNRPTPCQALHACPQQSNRVTFWLKEKAYLYSDSLHGISKSLTGVF